MNDHYSAFGISTDQSNNNSENNNTNNNMNINNAEANQHSPMPNNIINQSTNINPFRNPSTLVTLEDNPTTTVTNNTHSHGFTEINTELPISLSLNNNPSTTPQTNNLINQRTQSNLESMEHPSSSSHNNNNNNTILKNLRHYVYGADNSNSASNNDMDHNLVIDLPDNVHLPAPLSRKNLNKRKNKYGLFSIRLTPYIDNNIGPHNNPDNSQNSSNGNGLFFEPIIRTAGPGSQLVIGRYTERVREAISKLPEQYHPVVFKSKVISRAHGCFKVDSQGNWFIKDVKSSSGTFLNHQRLSPASKLSKDFLLHDGDILQLGMDFRGGIEEIYKCVKMKVELNRSWKRKANTFNKEALQRIKNLQKLINDGIEEEDCSICLSKIKPCQAIFISPCSHNWHFHCIRRLIMVSYPQFICPNCRSICDLEANLSESEDDMDDYVDDEDEVDEGEDNNNDINSVDDIKMD
ncbi:E3 ubiquitin-protein ligase Dma1p [Monosporozyma unispora]|nr:E3 ubiquitin-protein ligase dma2 [Kazachstania unispora]